MSSVGQAERVRQKRVIALFRDELGYRYLGDRSARVHLLEPSHNARFKALMSCYMPNWSIYRQMLNRLPGVAMLHASGSAGCCLAIQLNGLF